MTPRETLVLIVMCCTWAFHFVVMKATLSAMQPLSYAAIRMSLVALLLCPFLRWRAGQMRRVMLAGACFGGLNYAFMFSGIARTSATSAALAIEAYVPFATILAVVFLGDQIGLKRGIGIALALGGVALISLGGEAGDGAVSTFGIMLVLGAAITEAAGAILVKRIAGFRPLELLAWFAVVGAFLLWSLSLVLEPSAFQAVRPEDRLLLAGGILYSVIGASIIGHTCYYWLLQRLPISIVAPSGLLTTLLAVVLSVVLLREALSARLVAGGLMVVFGVGVILWRNQVKTTKTQPELFETPDPAITPPATTPVESPDRPEKL